MEIWVDMTRLIILRRKRYYKLVILYLDNNLRIQVEIAARGDFCGFPGHGQNPTDKGEP